MSRAHTPGPWAVTSSTGDVHSQARNGQNWICQGPNADAVSAPPLSERIANAFLYAAAPELLEALELADATLRGANMNRNVVERKVRAALDKARGGNPPPAANPYPEPPLPDEQLANGGACS